MKLFRFTPVFAGVLILQLFFASDSLASGRAEEGDPNNPQRGDGRGFGVEEVVTVLDLGKECFTVNPWAI